MSYLVLARKWRPRTFSELVGQSHVTHALIHSLEQQRLHHAYLFTGKHGTGKTSAARIMAKSLNCEQGITPTPCLTCDTCLAIEQGRFMDLIEVDAASKTKVEDTRELLENVQYAPTSGRFKIYLIDEVHMLSQHSFNALLKTLEEPPEHVKFLLATTDPQKLPVTILSRCLQFHLKPITQHIIADQLTHILQKEQQAFEPEAVQLLSKSAKGSMRDALSLLDQVIAGCGECLNIVQTKLTLGLTLEDHALRIIEALVSGDANALIQVSRLILEQGGNYAYAFQELAECLHDIALCQHLPDTQSITACSEKITHYANALSAEEVQLYYQIALKGQEDIQIAPSLMIAFEMTLLRMLAFKPTPVSERMKKNTPVVQNIKAQEAPTPETAFQLLTEAPPKPVASVINPIPEHSGPFEANIKKEVRHPEQREGSPDPKAMSRDAQHDEFFGEPQQEMPSLHARQAVAWSEVIPKLNLTGLALNAAENAVCCQKENRILTLSVDKGHQSLFTPSVISRLEAALSTYFSEPMKVQITTQAVSTPTPAGLKKIKAQENLDKAVMHMEQDDFVRQLQEEFSAQLVKESIEPAPLS